MSGIPHCMSFNTVCHYLLSLSNSRWHVIPIVCYSHVHYRYLVSVFPTVYHPPSIVLLSGIQVLNHLSFPTQLCRKVDLLA